MPSVEMLAQIDAQQKTIQELTERNEKLVEYADHKHDCQGGWIDQISKIITPCNCGFDELLAQNKPINPVVDQNSDNVSDKSKRVLKGPEGLLEEFSNKVLDIFSIDKYPNHRVYDHLMNKLKKLIETYKGV